MSSISFLRPWAEAAWLPLQLRTAATHGGKGEGRGEGGKGEGVGVRGEVGHGWSVLGRVQTADCRMKIDIWPIWPTVNSNSKPTANSKPTGEQEQQANGRTATASQQANSNGKPTANSQPTGEQQRQANGEQQANGQTATASQRANGKPTGKQQANGQTASQRAKRRVKGRGEEARRKKTPTGARAARVRLSQGAGVKSSVAQCGGSSELNNGLPQTRSWGRGRGSVRVFMPALSAKLLCQLGMGASSLAAVRTALDCIASSGGGRGAHGVRLVEGGLTENVWTADELERMI